MSEHANHHPSNPASQDPNSFVQAAMNYMWEYAFGTDVSEKEQDDLGSPFTHIHPPLHHHSAAATTTEKSSQNSICSSTSVEQDDEVQDVIYAFCTLLRDPDLFSQRAELRKSMMRQRQATRMAHCRQLERWDCVLRWLRDDDAPACGPNSSLKLTMEEETERDWILKTVDTQSIWTIDLLILLHKLMNRRTSETNGEDTMPYQLSCLYTSTKLEVDESYYDLRYYKTAFSKDIVRVTKGFEMAADLGLPMVRVRNLSLDLVLDVISRENCIGIVLLDNRVLEQHSQGDVRITDPHSIESQLNFVKLQPCEDDDDDRGDDSSVEPVDSGSRSRKEEKAANSTSYVGHYVVVCGVSSKASHMTQANCTSSDEYCVVLNNPGSMNATDFVAPQHFELAWRAMGTDEDIIFLAKH
eukprot:scaffold15821_cov56-Attheya_sp.AAC.2